MSFLALSFSRKLAPLFCTQFGGAFNDNVYKNGFAVILVYQLLERGSAQAGILLNLTQALFILPFLLFAAIAGNMGDVYDKAMLIRRIKIAEILIVLLAGLAFFLGSITLLIAIIFLLSTQSTFFGPLKYGIVPQHVPAGTLVNANALLSAGTFIAIIGGTLIGAYAATLPQNSAWLAFILLAAAVIGYLSSRSIPEAPPLVKATKDRISYRPIRSTIALIKAIYGRQPQYRPYLLGVSWFWFIGSVLLTQIPILTERQLQLEDISVSFFMILFAGGITCGALITGLVLRGKPTPKYAALTALLLGLFALDMILAIRQIDPQELLPQADSDYIPLALFLTQPHGIRLCLDFAMMSVFGGFYVIPLFTMIIALAKPKERARVIATNNIFNALFMVGSALTVLLLYALGGTLLQVFALIAISAFVVALLWYRARKKHLLRELG